ncbi:hypothetical protein ACIODW_15775 [Streptomyces sp. NPDC087897]|uniref:hypothetical protein n=1 Tax=Streptomyces sp. NPDC087897 TaxID=3365817 RepID=UPI0038294783
MSMRRDIWRGRGAGSTVAYPVKYLPSGTLPPDAGNGTGTSAWSVTGGGVTTWSPAGGAISAWSPADVERWRKAGGPAVLSPAFIGWVLAALVAAAYVLLYGVPSTSPAWHGGRGAGTDWLRYPGAVLLAALPLWYRYVPVAAVPAALYVAVEAGFRTVGSGGTDTAARSGQSVVLAACALAFTGGCLRLWARRRQRALTHTVAGNRRFPLPEGVPASDGHRGHRRVFLGLALALAAAGILIEGLVRDLTWTGEPYDAVGQQRIALVLLVAATTLYGRGQLAHRAARRLYEQEQPAMIVGVRVGKDGRHWVCPDARTTSAAPLVAYVPQQRDTRTRTRLLSSGSAYGTGNGHHDVDPEQEPFEAVLYGTVTEGDEVVLVHACAEYHRHQEMGRLYATVTTAPLRPDRRHGLGPWEPADGAARQRERLRESRERAERQREAEREMEQHRAERRREEERRAEERRRNPPRPSPPRSRGDSDRRSANTCGGCGSSCGGGGCGGCGG